MNFSVGIIGAGFAGIAVTANLVDKASSPLTIHLIESSEKMPKGIAFSTDNPKHLLNVRASQMDALPQVPDQFFHWLKTHQESWRQTDPYFASLALNPDNFYPRKLYGLFLEDLFQQTKEKARKKGISLILVPQKAYDIHSDGNQTFTICCGDQKLACDVVVLATGIPPYKELSFETPSLLKDKRYVANLWAPPTHSILKQDSLKKVKKTVLIIGSGLTMVDAVTSLVHRNFPGHLLVLSSSGALPEVHSAASLPPLSIEIKPQSLPGLLKEIHSEIKRAAASGKDWRAVIDAIRPSVPLFWQHLTPKDQKKFFRSLFTRWNKHRHRMSPESKNMLDDLVKKKRLEVHAGKILHLDNADPE